MAWNWPTSPRDRPPGRAPVGTSVLFTSGYLYPPIIFFSTLLALTPWTASSRKITNEKDLADFFVSQLLLGFAALAVWMIISTPYVFAFVRRRYIAVVICFTAGSLVAIASPICVLMLSGLLIFHTGSLPWTVVFTYLFGFIDLLTLITWPWLIRALRLKYWQPWTTPGQWESGDERGNAWVMRTFGIKSYEQREAEVAAKRKPGRSRR